MYYNDKFNNHKPETHRENEMCKILRDFAMQMDRLIQVRKPELITIW